MVHLACRQRRATRAAARGIVSCPFLTVLPVRLTHGAPPTRDVSVDAPPGSQSGGNFPKNAGIFFVHHSFTRTGSNNDIPCWPGFTLPSAASAKERPRSVTSDMQDNAGIITT